MASAIFVVKQQQTLESHCRLPHQYVWKPMNIVIMVTNQFSPPQQNQNNCMPQNANIKDRQKTFFATEYLKKSYTQFWSYPAD